MSVICEGFRGGDIVEHSYGGLPEDTEILLLEISGFCRVLIVFHIARLDPIHRRHLKAHQQET